MQNGNLKILITDYYPPSQRTTAFAVGECEEGYASADVAQNLWRIPSEALAKEGSYGTTALAVGLHLLFTNYLFGSLTFVVIV